MSLDEKLQKIRRLGRMQRNWLLVSLLGKDSISEEEYDELEESGFPLKENNLNLIEKSYLLGRHQVLSESSEYRDLTLSFILSEEEKASFSDLEQLTLNQAKFRAAENVKRLADDIAAGAYKRLAASVQDVITEATIKDIINDEVQLALVQRQSFTKLASNLANRLKTDWRRDWRMLAETEMHRAKVLGSAQAIINKLGIYSNSQGPNSRVSIVPNPDTCEDCGHHYLASDGNPQIFTIKDLLNAGSNASPDVSHGRKDGIHVGWKTTLPPLHPRCGCRLVYVPPGMGWENGRLTIVDEVVYASSLSKAVDRGSLSATVKPPGPKSTQNSGSASDQAQNPPSIAGAAAPSNLPSSGGGASTTSGPKIEWEYYKGEGTPPQEQGWEKSPAGAWRRPKGSGAAGSPEAEEAKEQLKQQDAKDWGKKSHPHSVVLGHLSKGQVESVENIGGQHANPAFLVRIAGNGRGVMKPPQELPGPYAGGGKFAEGVGTVPHGSNHKREAAAFNMAMTLGLSDFVPPTTTRSSKRGPVSMQQFKEGAEEFGSFVKEKYGGNTGSETLRNWINGSENPEETKNKVNSLISFDMLTNNNDRHAGNVMTDSEGKSFTPIDHGVSFGNGVTGYKCSFHKYMHDAGFKVTIPENIKTRIDNMSLGDFKRTLSKDLEDWEVGQAFLRARYMSYLQDKEGHLDYKKFEPEAVKNIDHTDEQMVEAMKSANPNWRPDEPFRGLWSSGGDSDAKKSLIYNLRKEKGQLPSQMFNSFAKDFLDKASNDSSHPDHEAAKELQEVGVFMGPGFADNPQGYRKADKHKEYEKSIKVQDIPDKVFSDSDLDSALQSQGISNEGGPASRRELTQTVNPTGGTQRVNKESEATTPPRGRGGTIPARRNRADDEKTKKSLHLYINLENEK